MDELQEKTAQVQEEVEQKLRTGGKRITAKASEAWDTVKTKSADIRDTAEIRVRENPISMLAGALLAGFAVGLLIRSAELRNERAARMFSQRGLLSRWGAILAAWGGFLAGRTRSGLRQPMESARDIADRVAVYRGSRLTRPFRYAWRRVMH